MPEIYKQPSPLPVKKSAFRETLSSFIINPTDIKFETQETNENIIIFMRAHPVTNLGWLLATFMLLVLPVLFLPIIYSAKFIPQGMPWGYFVIVPLLWYLGVLEYAFTNFLKWYFNVYIVTTKRVVDIDWISLLYKKFSSAQLEKIQDVSYKQGGVIDSFFNYGNVMVQTAGTDPNFEFSHIPNPDKVVREINKILEEHKKK